ncbi:dihydroorotate dehydrogenase [Aeriscardovia aeriphila]|uniref:Dihydroorotate dehydrogenase n=1 Tax=Aeriscardovia aeriphila TaxID=218139 RepID=A0A261F9I5_9BIFI|nr:dihydroorotate dehydrogenase [Aeriscardovia aeriphila]NYI26035.1 dihydroorotate dehydrogenase (NAD+) catalytic subunit [Aeriscardovia aeriphila]OZG55817.1 dihydroorotate dehydrogenase [Aeriscardovia aeriphila]
MAETTENMLAISAHAQLLAGEETPQITRPSSTRPDNLKKGGVVSDPRLGVELPGLKLKNPVMPASGTCWYGQEIARDYDLNRLGAIVLKTTTLRPREGNGQPRLLKSGEEWMNCNGLHNVGVEQLLADKLVWLEENYPDLPVIASVAGNSVEEYEQVATKLNKSSHLAALELNISCPNVKAGGQAMGVDPEVVEELTRRCVQASSKPVYVKLTPNVTDITTIALAAERGGAAGLTMINTLTGLRFDLASRKPILSNVTGGVSGPALKPICLRLIHQVRQVSDIPIIGVGGITSAEDVLEYLIAGAQAVQVGSASFTDPLALPKIISALPLVMDQYGIDNLSTLRGE